MTDAIVFENVVKTYGRLRALDGLSMRIPAAGLTGYVGPNGAGKTTSFRTMLGLTRPDSGDISVLGMSTSHDLARIVKRVGAVVDEPGLHTGLSAKNNMLVAASILGRGREGIDELLDFVTLGEVANKRVKGFSKGMRQRLALALAMLGDPEVLILDEPLDGLDPAGQSLLKEKLRSLVREAGMTVVVSSHDLADIEAMAQHVVVVDRGRVVAAGPVDDVVGTASVLVVTVDRPEDAGTALEAGGFSSTVEKMTVVVETTDGSGVARTLADAGIYPSTMIPRRNTLEQRFLELTRGGFEE